MGDDYIAIVEGISQLGQHGIKFRWGIDLGRAFHAERLMRAFGIEFGDEIIEAGLPLQKPMPAGLVTYGHRCCWAPWKTPITMSSSRSGANS